MNHEIESQLNGARYTFFGILQGVSSHVNLKVPTYVYHYTSWDKFCSMTESNSVRLHTVSNFEDTQERKLLLPVENRVLGTITDKNTGKIYDFASLINSELSRDHIFIQSNSTSNKNAYLWKKYGDNGNGVCLCFSTSRFIDYLNSTLLDFENLPDFMKCCYISYDVNGLNEFMEKVIPLIVEKNGQLGNIGHVVWFFLLEYLRNFLKNPDPYKAEKEIRFVVSENYSIFLMICSILSKWSLFSTKHPEELSQAFNEHYISIKKQLQDKLAFGINENGVGHVSIPLFKILDSITIGPNAPITKDKIISQTNNKLKKGKINKSFLSL